MASNLGHAGAALTSLFQQCAELVPRGNASVSST
jgi:hypothetical protein